MIRFLSKTKHAETGNTVTIIEMIDKYYEMRVHDELPGKIVEILADQFIKDRGAEILKRIFEQTIDSKLIQKVVHNLREELQKK